MKAKSVSKKKETSQLSRSAVDAVFGAAPSSNKYALNQLFWDRQRRRVSEGGCVRIYNQRYEAADPQSRASLYSQIGRDILIACDPANLREAIALDLDGIVIGRLKGTVDQPAPELTLEQEQQVKSIAIRERKAMAPERILIQARKALSPVFFDHLQECVDCGLLPLSAINEFYMLRLLVHVVPAAQSAQRAYGIPASVLIAIAARESAWGTTDFSRKHGEYFKTSSRHLSSSHDEGVELSFLNEAKHLTTDPRFRTATRYAGDALIYACQLCANGLGDDLYRSDITRMITEYELEECDRVAQFPPGTYLRQTDTYAPKPMYKKIWMLDHDSESRG